MIVQRFKVMKIQPFQTFKPFQSFKTFWLRGES